MFFVKLLSFFGVTAKGLLKWWVARLREPSSWASLAILLGFFGLSINVSDCGDSAGICIDETLWQEIVKMGVGAAGILAVVLKEKAPAQEKTEEGGDTFLGLPAEGTYPEKE